MDFDTWLVENDFVASDLSPKQKALLESQWRAETQPAGIPEPKNQPEPGVLPERKNVDVAAALAPQRAEYERQENILKLAEGYAKLNPARTELFQSIAQDAIDKNESPLEARIKMIEQGRGTGPISTFRPEGEQVDRNVIEAAVCMHGGLSTLEKEYDARTLETARKHYRNGLGLGELIHTFARRNGYRGSGVKSNLEANLRAAFTGGPSDLRAGEGGPSTYSVPNILANVANKFLRVSFMAVDDAWRSLAAVRSVPDFKQINTNALTGSLLFKEVPRGGEIKHGTIGERNYTNQASSYAVLLGIDRRDLINDDLGAFTTATVRVGRGGALKINDIFWSVFLNNSSFFTSGNANVSTGGGSVLASAGLKAADRIFRIQTDPDGLPLAVMPRILLAPPTLWYAARELMNSSFMVGNTTTDALKPSNNIFQGAYQLVTSPYMENSTYTGNSTAAWYLLADPNDMPVIEVVFVNGQQTPTVETSQMDWNTLGISMRGYVDFGVALQEFRGGVRSAGS